VQSGDDCTQGLSTERCFEARGHVVKRQVSNKEHDSLSLLQEPRENDCDKQAPAVCRVPVARARSRTEAAAGCTCGVGCERVRHGAENQKPKKAMAVAKCNSLRGSRNRPALLAHSAGAREGPAIFKHLPPKGISIERGCHRFTVTFADVTDFERPQHFPAQISIIITTLWLEISVGLPRRCKSKLVVFQ